MIFNKTFAKYLNEISDNRTAVQSFEGVFVREGALPKSRGQRAETERRFKQGEEFRYH